MGHHGGARRFPCAGKTTRPQTLSTVYEIRTTGGALNLFGKADASLHLPVFQEHVGIISRWGGYEEECHLLFLAESLQDGSSVRQYVFAGLLAAVRSRRPLQEGAWESCRGRPWRHPQTNPGTFGEHRSDFSRLERWLPAAGRAALRDNGGDPVFIREAGLLWRGLRQTHDHDTRNFCSGVATMESSVGIVP